MRLKGIEVFVSIKGSVVTSFCEDSRGITKLVQRYKHTTLPTLLTLLKTLTLLLLFTLLLIINSLHSRNSMNFHFPTLCDFQSPPRQLDTDFSIFWSSLMFQGDKF